MNRALTSLSTTIQVRCGFVAGKVVSLWFSRTDVFCFDAHFKDGETRLTVAICNVKSRLILTVPLGKELLSNHPEAGA